MVKPIKNTIAFAFSFMLLLTLFFALTLSSHATIISGMRPYTCGATTNSVWVLVECNSTSTATVDYGTTTSYGSTATTASTEATNASPVTYVHNIKITGLAANTTYHYRVRQGTSTSADCTFKTACNPGTSYRFAWLADHRNVNSIHDATASYAKTYNPAFILNGGDISDTNSYSIVKTDFFRTNELNLMASAPTYFAPGNHEGWNAPTKAWFQGPANNASSDPDFYSFDYGDAHFVMLNNYVSYSSGSAQWNFIDNDLASTTKTWKIVFAHEPGYCAGGRGENAAMKTISQNIFKNRGVDLVVTGHSHFYQHCYADGINQMVMGGCGGGLETPSTASYVIESLKDNNFAIFDITPTSLHLAVYNASNSLLDTLDLGSGPTPTPTPTPPPGYVDNCDNTSVWTGADAITLDTTNKKEGTGCLSKTGSGTSWFWKVFSTPVNAGVTESTGYLHLWLYVSDATKLGTSGQIEVTSSGASDINEYSWGLPGLSLVTGWNELQLPLANASKIGTPNLSSINYFRVYNSLTASITCKLDNIYFYTGSGPTPTPTPTPTPPPAALFSTSLETGDTQTTWADTVEVSSNVTGYPPAALPECSKRTGEQAHTGTVSLMYAGTDNSTTSSFCYYKVFDVNVPITAETKLGYWFYPQQENGRRVAIDFVCTDGTTLRDSGATTTTGIGMHPGNPKGTVNTWTNIKSNIGQWLSGKTIDRILVGYDQNANTGGYRGYIDDITVTNGTLP